MGTVVFPDAPHKFFLTASSEARVERRFSELVSRGRTDTTREQLAAEMARRDERDSSRATAPLARADDAVLIDSSALDIAAVVDGILARIRDAG